MHSLSQITALGQSTPDVRQIGSITCQELPNIALASVAYRPGKEKPASATLKKVLGAAAPSPGLTAGLKLSAFWTGPDQWMVEANYETHEDLAAQLAVLFKGTASVTEQTDAWVRFDLTGEGVRDVMERLCNLNLHTIAPGSVRRSAIHHLGCFVIFRAENHFSIIGPRSSAGSLHHAITTAMTSVQ